MYVDGNRCATYVILNRVTAIGRIGRQRTSSDTTAISDFRLLSFFTVAFRRCSRFFCSYFYFYAHTSTERVCLRKKNRLAGQHVLVTGPGDDERAPSVAKYIVVFSVSQTRLVFYFFFLCVFSAKAVDAENGFGFAVVNFRAGRVCVETR